ncbi:MAG: helicase-related protein [Anaerolineae bacterium]
MTQPSAHPTPNQTITPGDWLRSPFWQDVAQVISVVSHGQHDTVTLNLSSRRQETFVFTAAEWAQVERITQADRRPTTFTGDPERFTLGIQAYRLRLAHSIDPYAALNASRIDPLPHQYEAVYEHLLARPEVRALLAHDAGAGKTIMAGLLIKELKRRQAVRRVLIVAPAGLTIQWRRELLTKFGEDFTIISGSYIAKNRLDALEVWRDTHLAITSVDFARQKRMRQALESVEWDAVFVDEAHKMAAYRRPNGAVDKREAYKLGEILSRHSTHFVLMTATPHKGDPENYRLLVSLVKPDWAEATHHVAGTNPMVLRRTKEEMRRPDGNPLYPERLVETIPYDLSAAEGAVLEKVQKYIKKRFEKAKAANKQNAAFALVTLGRRMASSPYALRVSLNNLRTRLVERARYARMAAVATGNNDSDWADWEELTEEERWAREAQAETEAAALPLPGKIKQEIQTLDNLIVEVDDLLKQGESAKIRELQRACDSWIGQRGEQMIIFTEFKDSLDYLIQSLTEWNYTTTQIHGGMDMQARRQAERAFLRGEAQVLVATEAAGEGINLQVCRVMINFDLPWNPCRLEQRMGRIHRYGQKAPTVHIFNMLASNSIEDAVKEAIITKQKLMKKDLGDKVFDVVGQVLWGKELREILERAVLGEADVQTRTDNLLAAAETSAREAMSAEKHLTAISRPLDVETFRQKQTRFAAYRLSPEAAERFFERAVPFVGGSLQAHSAIAAEGQHYRVFEVSLPAELRGRHPRRMRFSFWPEVCTNDETEDDPIFYIAPGHWLLESLIDRVLADCAADLNQGAVLFDLQPEDESPYLAWFVRCQARDGLDRHVTDLLAVVRHRADEEQVTRLPSEILDGFEVGHGQAIAGAIRQVQPMLGGQSAVIDQCVQRIFLPELRDWRQRQAEAMARDRRFLEDGLTALANHFSEQAMSAYAGEDNDAGDLLMEQSHLAEQRRDELSAQMSRAANLLLTAPDVLGVALILPMPVELRPHHPQTPTGSGVPMRRNKEVEDAAMKIVMDYEWSQQRHPRDVSQGHSWDIESDNEAGELLRYIEVKGRGPEDALEVHLTDPEWEAARRHGDQHWLYIVRLGDKMMWQIQNPYQKLQPKELKRWVVRVSDVQPFAVEVKL